MVDVYCCVVCGQLWMRMTVNMFGAGGGLDMYGNRLDATRLPRWVRLRHNRPVNAGNVVVVREGRFGQYTDMPCCDKIISGQELVSTVRPLTIREAHSLTNDRGG